jgi:hypothetical protein
VGDGVIQNDLRLSGFLIGIDRDEAAAFAIDTTLAVAGKRRVEVRFDNGSVFESASPLDIVPAREWSSGSRKNLDAGDPEKGSAIGSARGLSRPLSGKVVGKN